MDEDRGPTSEGEVDHGGDRRRRGWSVVREGDQGWDRRRGGINWLIIDVDPTFEYLCSHSHSSCYATCPGKFAMNSSGA